MSDTIQELADIPKEFFKDGTQFINRCTKREFPLEVHEQILSPSFCAMARSVNTYAAPTACE